MQNMDTQFINQELGEQVFYEHRGFDFCYVAIDHKMLLNEYKTFPKQENRQREKGESF